MIKKYIHKINDLFYPFDKIFEIVVTGEDINVCLQFVGMCENFMTSNELLQYELEYSYNSRNNVFEIKNDKQNLLKFRFQALPENEWQKPNITVDILVPIFRMDKINPYSLAHKIDEFLRKAQQFQKRVITTLINFDYICNKPINSVGQWEIAINNIYEILHHNKKINEGANNINVEGQEILKGVFYKLYWHLNNNTDYTAYKICNFFCYNETNGFSFGKEEFFSNLLMHLLSFDKLNNYKYQIKI